jgi:hypothetical protein
MKPKNSRLPRRQIVGANAVMLDTALQRNLYSRIADAGDDRQPRA